jgi:hypothetical protein
MPGDFEARVNPETLQPIGVNESEHRAAQANRKSSHAVRRHPPRRRRPLTCSGVRAFNPLARDRGGSSAGAIRDRQTRLRRRAGCWSRWASQGEKAESSCVELPNRSRPREAVNGIRDVAAGNCSARHVLKCRSAHNECDLLLQQPVIRGARWRVGVGESQ